MAEKISSNRTVSPNEAKAALRKCIKIKRPVFMWGPPGIGKSDIVKQIGDEQEREVIDVRLSLWEPTDIKGIPYYNSQANTMSWAPPAELPTDPDSTAILFLDELNRGLVGVLNGMFQIVLDRELGSGPDGKPLKLHPGTQVVAAVNWGGSYTVNEMDDALLSRFWTQDFKPTVQDWIEWASASGVNALLVDFIRANPSHLRPTKAVEPGKKTPDQRAWVKLDETLKHMGINLEENGGNP
ncbi:MAG: hypothetical protein EB038_10140, partial [Cyclobacteriaceae bacterium]|nr:hypothetical protein [Cyclobacteriaceae bacterium]